MTTPIQRLARLGQSVWYDFITRDFVEDGDLAKLIRDHGLRGMTSNPTIFEKAISDSALYDEDLRRLQDEGSSAEAIFDALAIRDVQSACDVFRPVFDELQNGDGTVSLEVAPSFAYDGDGSLAEAARLWAAVDRPNVMIKIPGTAPGLAAIRQATAQGININITLLFSVERYREVIEAYLAGLEARVGAGKPISGIYSVASFFVSRVDSNIDKKLDQHGDPSGVRGRTAIANAAAAYSLFEETMAEERWRKLAALGATLQRPLWASTSTKDPKYPDVYYVENLIAPYTVNTLPPDTFDAYEDHGNPEVRIDAAQARMQADLDGLGRAGISLQDATAELEQEGVDKFAKSYDALIEGIRKKMGTLAGKG